MANPKSRSGDGYLSSDVLAYVGNVHARHDSGLEQAFTAPERENIPAIQVNQSEGRLLELLTRMVAAEKAVEVGTLAGYSAIWIARGLAPGGKLWSIESDPRHAEIARANLARAGVADRVEVVVGAGSEVLGELASYAPFDFVFVDADKGSYDRYGAWAATNLRSGGLLVGDNAFYFSKLLDESQEALAMRTFHENAAKDFHSVCVPTPDGLVVGIRK